MGNKTQLARIVVPAITDVDYADGISNAFKNINDNFKKIASLPFVQGVQGDSYKLVEREIWDTTTTKEDPNLTSYGVVLLNSIFAGLKLGDSKLEFNITDTFSVVNTNLVTSIYGTEIDEAGNPYPSPLSLDFFYTTETKDGKTEINQVINNILYFYTIFDDANEITDEYLGQYYYFIDNRLKNYLGEAFNGNKSLLDNFVDYTGFYGYVYNEKSTDGEYRKIDILPTLYYDTTKNDICWKFNGQNTGISAIGPKGEPGKDSDFQMVCVDLEGKSISTTSNSIVKGVFKKGTNDNYDPDSDAVKDLKDSYCMIFIQNCAEADLTEQTVIGFGEIITNQDGDKYAYWNSNTLLNTTAINGLVQSYFYNMGTSNTSNSPHFLAIPANSDRTGIKANDNHAHVFKTNIENYKTDESSVIGGDLEVFYSSDAFSNGLTNGGASVTDFGASGSVPNMNIKNYNVNIDKNLGVTGNASIGGTLSVTSAATFNGGLDVTDGDLDVTDNASIGGTLSVTSDATIGNDLIVANGNLCVTNGDLEVTSGDLVIGDNLDVKGTATIGDTLSVTSDATIGGNLGVTGTATLNSDLTVGGTTIINGETTINNNLNIITSFSEDAIFTIGGATIQGDVHIKQNNPGTSTGSLIVDNALTVKNGAVVTNGDLEVTSGNLVVGGDLEVTGDTTIGYDLEVNGESTFNKTVSIIGTPYDSDNHPGLIVEGGNGGSRKGELGGVGLIVRGGTSNKPGSGTITTGLGLRVETGGAVILNDLTVGETLDVVGTATFEDGATFENNVTINGTTRILNDLEVRGGLFVEKTSSFTKDLSVGTQLNVNGNVIICDKSGKNPTTISSSVEGADINGVKIIDSKVKAPNGFFQTSDERLKNIIKPISVDLDKLSKLRKVYFKWKDKPESAQQLGMIAQDVQKIYPELVYEDGGRLSLAYDKLSVITLEAIDELYKKNQELEKRIQKLENIILK